MSYHEFMSSGALGIVDFGNIDREIQVSKSDGTLILGGKMEKGVIETTNDLRKILGAIALTVCKNIQHDGIYINGIRFVFEVPELDEHFFSQLVFDVLYDLYLAGSPLMTLNEYCKQLTWFEWDESLSSEEKEDIQVAGNGLKKAQEAAKRSIYEELKREDRIKRHESLRNDAELFGISPERYDEYLDHIKSLNIGFNADNKKPKYVWDYLYYNGNRKLMTYKQYRRRIIFDKHYSYYDFEKDFKRYDEFTEKFVKSEEDSDQNSFLKAMEFYNLEIYHRLDFIYKLAVRMEKEGMAAIDRCHPIVKRFHPQVQYYYIKEERPHSAPRLKYYRPFFFVEKVCPEVGMPLSEQTEGLLLIYYIVRAKSYEMFNYKFKFVPDGYADMWAFISTRFDVLSYHDPSKEWFNEEAKRKSDQYARIKNAGAINDALFWESEAKTRPTRAKRGKGKARPE